MELYQNNINQNYHSDSKQIIPLYETKALFLKNDKSPWNITDKSSNKKYDFVSRINTGNTLLVGEGNFSFTLSLFKKSKGNLNVGGFKSLAQHCIFDFDESIKSSVANDKIPQNNSH